MSNFFQQTKVTISFQQSISISLLTQVGVMCGAAQSSEVT